MSSAEIIGSAPQLVVKNVAQTVAFYKECLGFEILGLVGNPAVYGMVQRNDFQIHFAHATHGTVHTNRSLNPLCNDLILWIPDIDAFYAEIKAKGVLIVEEITKRPYGSKEFVFQDLDGHHVLVGD
ncbi:MAG: hypothetical protein RLZZ241_2164 [Bacteroidota bacterium]|jgi:uncharacterized glyoxalase superfamily protein PhnB